MKSERDKFTQSLQFGTQVYSDASSIQDAEATVEKVWEKLENIAAWQVTKVRNKKEVIDEARNEGTKSSFCLTDGHLSFEECRIGGKAPKIQKVE